MEVIYIFFLGGASTGVAVSMVKDRFIERTIKERPRRDPEDLSEKEAGE